MRRLLAGPPRPGGHSRLWSMPGRRATQIGALVLLILAAFVWAGPWPAPATAAERPLRYLAGEAGTLDPAFIANAGDVQLLLQLYAGLSRLDEDGEPYPSLAEGWEVSDDGLRYTFRLRDGLRFSDGSPLVAADVRRSWLRVLDPETGASAPDVLTIIRGAVERLEGRVAEEEVGIDAPDDRTLVVELRHRAGYFPAMIATPTAFVVPNAAGTDDTWQSAERFVGSGPYFVDAAGSEGLVLRANPHYVAGPPPIERIEWLAEVDGDAVSAFADDDLDLTQIGHWDAAWVSYDELGRQLHRAPSLSIQFFGFDTTRPPFDDPRVRRAFALALDRPRLVELALGRAARAAPSIVPPALWPEGWRPGFASDPAEARRLLDEAGYADRSDLGVITVNGTGLGVDPAVATWRQVLGVEIAVEHMRFTDYLVEIEERSPPIFTINWIADYPSPHALYGLLLMPGSASNYGGWRDDAFMTLVEEISALIEPEEQAQGWQRVDARVAEEVPVIPWAYGEDWWLVRSGLRGLGSLTVGLLDFGRVSWSD